MKSSSLWYIVIQIDEVGKIRSGNWNNGSNAGMLTLNLNNSPGNTNDQS